MQPLPPASGRSGRLLLVAAALVVLLAVVAFASRSGFGDSGHAAPNGTYVSYAFTVFLILFVLMIPVALWAWLARAREVAPTRKQRGWQTLIRPLLVVAVFSILVYVRHWLHLRFHTVPSASQTGQGKQHGPGKAQLHQAATEATPHFEWTVLWIALGLAAVGLTALFVFYRRWKQRRPTPGPTPAEQLVTAIDDAIGDLESEPDPRRAVIAAYARMERTLGRHGLGRRPSETPIEYLGRVLHELTASTRAVERLTALFERAKFSPHPVTAEMKQTAIAALGEIRAGIA